MFESSKTYKSTGRVTEEVMNAGYDVIAAADFLGGRR
jgi:hypothetical protein